MNRASRILLVHSDIYGFGGAELVALRAICSLQRFVGEITLVHSGAPLDCERIEKHFGLTIDPSRVRFVTADDPFKLGLLGNLALLKYAMALRHASRIAAGYTAVITTYGECTIPHPRGLQFVHHPLFFFDRENLAHLGVQSTGAVKQALRAAYVRLARAIAGWDPATVRSHLVATNSHWTGEQFIRCYGSHEYRVIYPGADVSPGLATSVPFTARSNDFVMLGRAVPNKRIETGIEIVRRLRDERGHEIGLDIVGSASGSYGDSLREYTRERPWIRWHSGLGREALERLIVGKKWGLHCFQFEHYGLAAVELQQLGCVVFVPDTGGQREIVRDEMLRYSNVEDAVAKIDKILRASDGHAALLASIGEWNELHRSGAFYRLFDELVEKLLSSTSS